MGYSKIDMRKQKPGLKERPKEFLEIFNIIHLKPYYDCSTFVF